MWNRGQWIALNSWFLGHQGCCLWRLEIQGTYAAGHHWSTAGHQWSTAQAPCPCEALGGLRGRAEKIAYFLSAISLLKKTRTLEPIIKCGKKNNGRFSAPEHRSLLNFIMLISLCWFHYDDDEEVEQEVMRPNTRSRSLDASGSCMDDLQAGSTS